LWDLLVVCKRTERQHSHKDDATSQLDAVGELNGKERSLAKTVCSQQIDKICWRKVKVDVLEAQ
jgi:hypothetical protein